VRRYKAELPESLESDWTAGGKSPRSLGQVPLTKKKTDRGAISFPAVVFAFPVPAVSGPLMFFVTCYRPGSFPKASERSTFAPNGCIYQFVSFGIEFQLGVAGSRSWLYLEVGLQIQPGKSRLRPTPTLEPHSSLPLVLTPLSVCPPIGKKYRFGKLVTQKRATRQAGGKTSDCWSDDCNSLNTRFCHAFAEVELKSMTTNQPKAIPLN
jgi:hypothetical protein